MEAIHRVIILSATCFFLTLLLAGMALGWQDRTHLAIAKAAGYESWYNAAGADMAKLKAGNTEGTNHWFNNTGGVEVTDTMVMDQAERYNKASDTEGHLYGAIIASLRRYIQDAAGGKYAGYHMAFCAHYIGDLSMPLHNVPYDDFNERHHNINDGIVEPGVLDKIGLIRKHMHPIAIRDEHELAREIAGIANMARGLALKMKRENREMTRDEAYIELARSASLLKAVLSYARGKGRSGFHSGE
jgi:hypothetical protein